MVYKVLIGLILVVFIAFLIHIIFLIQGAESPLWNTTFCQANNGLDLDPPAKCDGGAKSYIVRCRAFICLRDYEITEDDPILSVN